MSWTQADTEFAYDTLNGEETGNAHIPFDGGEYKPKDFKAPTVPSHDWAGIVYGLYFHWADRADFNKEDNDGKNAVFLKVSKEMLDSLGDDQTIHWIHNSRLCRS